MASNPFFGLTLNQLQTLQANFLAALPAIASNQSYSLNGRSLTRANLNDIKDTLSEIQAAIDDTQGNTSDTTYVDFTTN